MCALHCVQCLYLHVYVWSAILNLYLILRFQDGGFVANHATMIGSTGWCHLCGLRIPPYVASPNHPLYGTVDHVIPLSQNGPDRAVNRRAAHRFCNMSKGSTWPVTVLFRRGLQRDVKVMLIRLGENITRKHMARARERAGIDVSIETPETHQRDQVIIGSRSS